MPFRFTLSSQLKSAVSTTSTQKRILIAALAAVSLGFVVFGVASVSVRSDKTNSLSAAAGPGTETVAALPEKAPDSALFNKLFHNITVTEFRLAPTHKASRCQLRRMLQ